MRNRGRSLLLVSEVALSLVLLARAGLMIRSLLKLQNLPLGFNPAGLQTTQINPPSSRYPIDPRQYRPTAATPGVASKRAQFFALLGETLAAIPDVQAVGRRFALPLHPAGIDYDLPVVVEGRP